MKRKRIADCCLPDRKRPRTMEVKNRFYDLPIELIEHIFTFIKRPKVKRYKNI